MSNCKKRYARLPVDPATLFKDLINYVYHVCRKHFKWTNEETNKNRLKWNEKRK